jgi:hypothetical protein
VAYVLIARRRAMVLAVVDRLLSRLVPDVLWVLAEPLIPEF